MKIPDIVHSTVVRFAKTPLADGVIVQSNFRRLLLDGLATDHDPQSFPVHNIKLVCERQPYMHVPQDDRHVLWVGTLEEEEEDTKAY